MEKIKDAIPEIGLIIVLVTGCAVFAFSDKLSAELFSGMMMVIIGSFYGVSQNKKSIESVISALQKPKEPLG